MSSVVISGDTSGNVTLAAAATASNNTVTLPSLTGTAALTSDVIGVGQTWANLISTGPRAIGTTYTNSTGKPIAVHIYCSGTGVMTMTIGGVAVGGFQSSASAVNGSGTWIIPNGTTYVIAGTGTLSYWSELR